MGPHDSPSRSRPSGSGFESIWLFDHFQTIPRPTDEITFESFTSLSALAALTSRVRLGHVVICTAFRNPALTAKMIATLDSISGGRMELGIGAGWKQDEWLAYGYGFPETRERLARLADDLEVIARMLAGDRPHATYEGTYAQVRNARQRPAADPAAAGTDHGRRQRPERDLAARRPLRRRAEPRLDDPRRGRRSAAGHPLALRGDRAGSGDAEAVGPHLERAPRPEGAPRVDLLAAYREVGVDRVMTLVRGSATSDEALGSLARDAREAGLELA